MVLESQRTRPSSALALSASLLAVVLASALGGLATSSAAQDYGTLKQPAFAPP